MEVGDGGICFADYLGTGTCGMSSANSPLISLPSVRRSSLISENQRYASQRLSAVNPRSSASIHR